MISSELKLFFSEKSDDYFKACNLMLHGCKNDPVSTPYQSYYNAREILSSLLEKLKSRNSDDHCLFIRPMAVIHLKLGINYIETEEQTQGEEHLKKCKALVESCDEDLKQNFGILLPLLNQLGLLYSQRRDFDQGLKALMEAESTYQKFKIDSFDYAWLANDFFNVDFYNSEPNEEAKKERIEVLEDDYTHTLYYLAQVYSKLERNFDSAQYCKETLKRQLSRHKYEPLDWSMNAATLSQFYTSNNDFGMARHCMASAELILKEFGDKPGDLSINMKEIVDQDEADAKEKLPKAWADLYRCWVKYAISLLEYSREKLYQKSDDNGEVDNFSKHDDFCNSERQPFNLELTSIENQITDKPVLVFTEAREVFLRGQKWISDSKQFYILDGHCSDYVDLVKDHSCLFKLLAFFEVDLNRQCKMLKRRADMLSEVLHELNPRCYSHFCQQLSFEIGEVYSAMLDNKLALLELSEGIENRQHTAQKINKLARQSIEYFQTFLKFLKNQEGNFPPKFSEELERPALIAHFYCGRLFSKLITSNHHDQILNSKKSLECYKYLVDYCASNPTAIEKVKEERSACEEMVQLLPAKIDRIGSKIIG